jgi:hypothetical protein
MRRNFSAKEVSPQGHRAHRDFNKGEEKGFQCKGGFTTGTQSAQRFKNVGEIKGRYWVSAQRRQGRKGGFTTGTQSAQRFKNVGEKKELFIGFRSMALRRRGYSTGKNWRWRRSGDQNDCHPRILQKGRAKQDDRGFPGEKIPV